MNIINQNPYRVIGVFANSKTKERVANINRIKAFIKVNKSIEFPLDLKTLLPEINRSLEEVNNAEANLTLPNDQIKYAQFWFINETSFDEIAFNNLFAGDITKALEIWRKKDNQSSLHNRIVVLLANKNFKEAILLAEKFYTEYGTAFIDSIADNSNLNSETIGFNFVNTLCDEFGLNQIMPHISKEEWKTHLSSQAITPIIEKLQSAVETAKASKGKAPKDRYNAGVKLVNEAKKLLTNLREFLSTTDLQYQMIADKVGLEVLQCGIDYYNGSDDDDAAHKAMPLQQYALSVVVGKMAKDRCNENVKILQKIIDKLPPKEIAKEIDIIKKKIEQYLNNSKGSQSEYDELYRKIKMRLDLYGSSDIEKGITLIKECAPSLANIKEFEGIEGDNYINLSSIIVSVVLGKTIEIVNKCLDGYKTLYSHPSSNSITELKKVLNKAWEATLYMSVLNVNAELKQRFQTQKVALSKLLLKVGSTPVNSINFKIETEAENYNNCKTINDYKNYIELFPNGEYLVVAKKKLKKLQQIEDDKRIKLLEKIDSSSSLDELIELKQECPWSDVLNILENKCFELCKKKKDFKKFINIFGPYSKYLKKAERKIKFKNLTTFSIIVIIVLITIGLFFGVNVLLNTLCVCSFLSLYAFASLNGEGCLTQLCCLLLAVVFGLGAFLLYDYTNKREYDKLYEEAKSIGTIDAWKNYQMEVPYKEFRDSQHKIDSLEKLGYDSLYKTANSIGTINAWKHYQKDVPIEEYRDSQHKIDSLENLTWNTESKAWKEAQKQNSLFAYKKYKKKYPNGKHISQAEKKIIDLEVAEVYAGDYGTLPSMDKVSYGSGPTTRITVENNTSYTLTILYSGTDSKRLVIRPNGKSSVTLKNGVYKIAASVNAYNVSKYAGTEHLNGGSYESSYYISTTPSYRHY